MIDYIKGTLVYIDLHYIVVETGGIGYQVHMSNPFQLQHKEQEEITIYTYQHVREDILALYGFISREERSLYEKLLLVSGVGPKAALSIMSAGTPGQLIIAIQSEDLAFLTRLPGVGKKTAQRLIIDLKDKLGALEASFAHELVSYQPAAFKEAQRQTTKQKSNEMNEAIEALYALGYSEKEVNKILPEWKEQGNGDWTTDRYIKLGLQLLMK
ncbi:Holliday junction branch migration protein RuvA [Caldalkalibacillus mannanilyticus]|uniref:Holliday junction branch migration protein RuvA n=1 Tax=Caldalkalibacillus mannanilyticus TaxID=1418 RepID=UPI000468900B|nr:Holliday junction branch migration protein RuvA [Caldalkalibacillus mannanilyticus]